MLPSDAADSGSSVRACVAYDRSGQRVGEITLEAISDMLALPDRFVWVGLYEPDVALLAQMQEEFALHPLAVEDAGNAHQRPKLEAYGESLFIVARTASRHGVHVRFGETHVFLGRNYILTVRHGDSPGYAAVRRAAEQAPALLAQSLSGILCLGHSMTTRSMYATQDEDSGCGRDGVAVDSEGID